MKDDWEQWPPIEGNPPSLSGGAVFAAVVLVFAIIVYVVML